MLHRIGTGIVGGVAGVALGFAVTIAMPHKGIEPEKILMACGIGGVLGLILGFVFAKPKKPTDKLP